MENLKKAGLRIQGNPSLSTPGLGVGSIATDPTGAANGDIWYSSTDEEFKFEENHTRIIQ